MAASRSVPWGQRRYRDLTLDLRLISGEAKCASYQAFPEHSMLGRIGDRDAYLDTRRPDLDDGPISVPQVTEPLRLGCATAGRAGDNVTAVVLEVRDERRVLDACLATGDREQQGREPGCRAHQAAV